MSPISVCNLRIWHEAIEVVATKCPGGARGCAACKGELGAAVDAFWGPIRERRAELKASRGEVLELLLAGTRRARAGAAQTLGWVKAAMHLDYPGGAA